VWFNRKMSSFPSHSVAMYYPTAFWGGGGDRIVVPSGSGPEPLIYKLTNRREKLELGCRKGFLLNYVDTVSPLFSLCPALGPVQGLAICGQGSLLFTYDSTYTSPIFLCVTFCYYGAVYC
jgi:hypothetical protein